MLTAITFQVFKIKQLKNLPSICGIRKFLVHTLSTAEVYKRNLEIGELGRVGQVVAACQVFDRMPNRDVVSWNAMITAHWQNDNIEESKRLFDLMPVRNKVSWNSMIAGCIENRSLDEAFEYFSRMPRRNVSSWNVMLSGFVKFGSMEIAERLFEKMPVKNVVSYTMMVDGFARKGETVMARQLFDSMPNKNVVSFAAMINGYVDNGELESAEELFVQVPEKNVVAFTAMLVGYCKAGRVEKARSLFDQIPQKDLIAWNAMIAGYANNGHGEEALLLHKQMLENSFKSDHATLIGVLMACSSLALLNSGRQAHAIAVKIRLESNTSVSNALITMYSKCGGISESESVFEQLRTRDAVSWNSMIASSAHHGHYGKAAALFRDMEKNKLIPDSVTFLSILSACAHGRKVKESLEWFRLMKTKYAITPSPEHYACIIDMLCRAGQFDKAYEYTREMPHVAEGSVWSSLLAACQKHLKVEIGELAAKKLVELDSNSSGAYVMLSNIYAAAGMWKKVTEIRGLMKEQGTKKQPGYSWIEIYNKVHMFMVGEASHQKISEIYSELERISLHMKPGYHVPDLFQEHYVYEC